MDDRQELEDLRRLEELQSRAGAQPDPTRFLGGTLQLGVPFTGKSFDTGIPLPQSLEAGIVGAGKTVSDLIAGVRGGGLGTPGKLEQEQAAAQKAYAPLSQAFPVSTFLGEAAPYVAMMPAAGSAAGAAAIGAVPGLVGYGTPEQRLIAGGLGAGANALGYGAGKLLAKAVAPGSEAATKALQNQWDIPLRPAQVSKSAPVQIVDAVLSNLPGSSGVIQKAKSASYQGFNRAVGEQMGLEGAAKLTPELIGQAQDVAGKQIGNIAARNTFVYTDAVDNAINAVRARAASELEASQQKVVENQINNFLAKVGPDMTAPGQAFQSTNQTLRKLVKTSSGTMKDVLGDLRGALMDGFDKSISMTDSAAWAEARKHYLNSLIIGNAARATPGSLSPSQLLTSVNAMQPKARFGAGNDLATLAQWAKPTLGDVIPNSGTAQRMWWQNLLTNPITALAGTAGAGYGINRMGFEDTAKDLALTGAVGIPSLYLMGKGMTSPALAAYLAKAPVSKSTQKLLEDLGRGLIGAPGVAGAGLLASTYQQ